MLIISREEFYWGFTLTGGKNLGKCEEKPASQWHLVVSLSPKEAIWPRTTGNISRK